MENQLQNFTTKEQSKQLLKMGLPANSADCYHNDIACRPFTIPQGTLFSDPRHMFTKETLPCWSVGRLIEIYATCTDCSLFELPLEDSLIETLIDGIEWNRLDFSKLED